MNAGTDTAGRAGRIGMERELYYLAYEKRCRTVFEAGADRWGHSPDDPVLRETLTQWVRDNRLSGKTVLEFACGEGACGVILSQIGCRYHGVDIAPSAVRRAEEALRDHPGASVEVRDMVKDPPEGQYDAALDCMGFHMLVTDGDRRAYLSNAFRLLRKGAPMLFFRESYRREGVYRGPVDTFEE